MTVSRTMTSSYAAQRRLGDIQDEIAAIFRAFPELAAVWARPRWEYSRRQRTTARSAMLRRLRRALAAPR
jgi:hypothetical protein